MTESSDEWTDKSFTHEDIKASFDAGFHMGFRAGVAAQKQAHDSMQGSNA